MRIAPLPPLHCLVAFEASVRHMSFTKAAAELHLTQSAVSRQIAQLEGFLGRSLFDRDYRALHLTPAGERYAHQIRQMLETCAETTLDVMKHPGNLELTVACSSGVALMWLTPRLGEFRLAHPNVRLRMIVRDGLASMSPEEFDVGLYYLRRHDEAKFTARRLFEEEVFPVCAPGYLDGRLLAPEALTEHTLLVLEDGQRQWMSWPEWFGYQNIAMPRSHDSVVINYYPQLVQMAVLKQGIVLGWRYMVDPFLEQGLLMRATRESASHGGGYYVVEPRERTPNHAARFFTRWLFEQADLQLGAAPG